MDRATRWETEAIRKRPPKPTRKQKSGMRIPDSGNWVTLREAEAETGIPVNTLRKWIRKTDLPSYLEADGDLALRMIDLDAVVARAKELGRDIVPPSAATPSASVPPSGGTGETESSQGGQASARPSVGGEPGTSQAQESAIEPSAPPPDTMIVPVDAWNKMLNQLGNLHEAGQQLAEARERAAKAETESKFLRAQLAETRDQRQDPRAKSQEPEIEPEPSDPAPGTTAPDTTTYWRYVTSGWRQRKKRRR
jgi:hypothetical protein